MNIEINNISLRYECAGDGADILFLHGWGSSLDAFGYIFRDLSKDFRCVGLDFPGCGKSEEPKNPLTLDDYCDIVLKFIEKVGLNNPVLVGHSNGGRVILKLCGEGKINPPKIILMDAAGIKPKKTFKQKWRQKQFKTIKWALSLPIIKNYTKDLLESARNHYGSADYRNASPVMRQTLVNLVNMDLCHLMGNIKSPTLLIWGDRDTATPLSDGQTMEKLIPDAGLCVINGGSHFSFIDDPGRVNLILRSFLGGKNG